MRNEKLPNRAAMSDAQRACFDLLCEVFHGEHHVPEPIYAWGRGIKCNALAGRLATFDFNELTRLVILAHDRAIRVELTTAGPGRVGIVLHQRKREGAMYERHPTIEEAIAKVRPPST